jgi:cell wall-associated NlpC family hydrolase
VSRLRWVAPDDLLLEDPELTRAPNPARDAIRIAHSLACERVAYRRDGTLKRADLEQPPRALSCSELVYYAFARSGVELGDEHMRTRFLAYSDPHPYAASMIRVSDGSILPGDLLVYHWDREEVERWLIERGKTRPGHVVIAVSSEKRLVIGSHGKESTPEGGLTGVGYRILDEGFGSWTRGRTLRAVYRLYGNESSKESTVPVSRA